MKITFKDVGQGDSIIIEWNDNGVNRIGIIDCNKKGGRNPIVEHLTQSNYAEIEFIVLSHPHSDHYSGFLDLFSFLEGNGIIIKNFGHSFSSISIEYWKWFEVTSSESKALSEIIHKANSLRESGILKKFFLVTENVKLPVNGIEITTLAPSHTEFEVYQKEVKFDSIENKKSASKAANFLSSLFYVKKDESLVLLTSDVEKITFERLNNEGVLNTHLFSLCQAPHHGSFNNYYDQFWNNLKTIDGKNVVFSSGLNEKYKHPHLATVKSFASQGYKINPTNLVYGIQEFLDEIDTKTLILDTISEIDEESIVGGDKIFEF